jgi:hypothetical protein
LPKTKVSCPSEATSLGKRRLNVSPKHVALGNNVSSPWRKMKFSRSKKVPYGTNEIPKK